MLILFCSAEEKSRFLYSFCVSSVEKCTLFFPQFLPTFSKEKLMMMHRLYRNTLLWRIAHANHFQVRGITFSFFLNFSSLFLIFSVCSSNQHQLKEQSSSFSLLLCTNSHCLQLSGSVSVFNFVLVSNNRGLILIDWQKRRGKALESKEVQSRR